MQKSHGRNRTAPKAEGLTEGLRHQRRTCDPKKLRKLRRYHKILLGGRKGNEW